MTTLTKELKPPRRAWSSARAMRKFISVSLISFIAFILLLAFLMPLGYMVSTATKNLQQVQDDYSRILPMSPVKFSYKGQDYPILKVPTDKGIRELALVTPTREESDFVDPQNPAAGLVHWVGRWRELDPVYRFDPTFNNFPEAWDQVKFGLLFRNTLIIAVAGTVGTLLSSVCVAYGFSRFRIPGINIIFLILISTIILPTQITLIPTYIFFRSIGWAGTWWPLIIPHFFANAYNVFLLRQYFRSIPKEMDESAMIDGASPFRILISIILPQSIPALTAVGLFHFFWSWNDFFAPLVYLQGKEELYTISVGLTQFNNIFTAQPGYAMAAAMMAITVPILIFFFAQSVFMQGIVITGVEK